MCGGLSDWFSGWFLWKVKYMRSPLSMVVLLVLGLSARSGAGDIREDILNGWRARHANHQAAEYRTHGTVLAARGSCVKNGSRDDDAPPGTVGPLPPEDYRYDTRAVVTLDLKAGRARREVDRQTYYLSRLCFIPDWHWDLFDGKNFQFFQPREKNKSPYYEISSLQPDLELFGTKTTRTFFTRLDFPLLFAHGVIPTRHHPASPAHLAPPQDMEEFSAKGKGMVDDRECVILETRGDGPESEYACQYWIDVARDSAVARVSWLVGSRVVSRLDITYSETSGGWCPKEWIWKEVAPEGGETPEWEKVSCDAVVFDSQLSDDLFRVEPTAGMVIRDHNADREPGENERGDERGETPTH